MTMMARCGVAEPTTHQSGPGNLRSAGPAGPYDIWYDTIKARGGEHQHACRAPSAWPDLIPAACPRRPIARSPAKPPANQPPSPKSQSRLFPLANPRSPPLATPPQPPPQHGLNSLSTPRPSSRCHSFSTGPYYCRSFLPRVFSQNTAPTGVPLLRVTRITN
ncbi:hypothetical protein BDZ91DRAFT_105856 [Kalaharituber pfeilii]|nr:hypothetical protein BDZ91DRAFT_105856 [Kalaharituber pfeilii]